MKLLPSVNPVGVAPALWLYLGALARDHRNFAGAELVVTSLRRPAGGRPSKHSPGVGRDVEAADLRRWALDDLGLAESWCRSLQQRFGDELGVVLEPEWLTEEQLAERGGLANVQPHVHVQLKTAHWPGLL